MTDRPSGCWQCDVGIKQCDLGIMGLYHKGTDGQFYHCPSRTHYQEWGFRFRWNTALAAFERFAIPARLGYGAGGGS